MTNPFASLRQETQGLLPEPWYEYPLLKEFDLEVIYNKDKEYIQLRLGIQDGLSVVGLNISDGISTKGFNPGRKWGQFNTTKEARLWALGYILERPLFLSQNALNAVKTKITEIRQLILF